MFKPVSLFIGLRYSRLAKGSAFISFISFFSIAGIALGITALFTVVSVMDGFEQNLKRSILYMLPHVQVSALSEQSLSAQQLSQLKASPQVQSVQRYAQAQAILQTNSNIQGVSLQGVFNGQVSPTALQGIEQGSWQAFSDSRYQLAISRYLARKLNVSVGDKIRVITPQVSTFTPMGRVPSQRLFTVAVIYRTDSELDSKLAFTTGESLSRLLKKGKKSAPSYRIMLNDPFEVAHFLQQNSALLHNVKVTDWRQSQGGFFAAVAMEKRMMSLLLGLIILVAIFNIVSALTMMVREKQSEVAILQTLGLTPSQVRNVFMTQGVFNGVIGALIGAILALLVTHNLNAILALLGANLLGGVALPIVVSYSMLAAITLGSIFMSFMATIYPAKKASQVQPAEVLRYE